MFNWLLGRFRWYRRCTGSLWEWRESSSTMERCYVRVARVSKDTAGHGFVILGYEDWSSPMDRGVLDALRQDVTDAWKEVEVSRNCPCRDTTPCDERCSCVCSASSSGCRRCVTYGSAGQRKLKAVRIAAKIDLEFPDGTVELLHNLAHQLRYSRPASGSRFETADQLDALSGLIDDVERSYPEGWTKKDFMRELGRVPEWVKFPPVAVPQSEICPECSGAGIQGEQWEDPCKPCGGTGLASSVPAEPVPDSNIRCMKRADLEDPTNESYEVT